MATQSASPTRTSRTDFNSSETVYLPTVARDVFDVSGAGDTVISVYTAAKCAGASHVEAMVLANIAGGVVVGKLGTATVSVAEILAELEHPQAEIRRVAR